MPDTEPYVLSTLSAALGDATEEEVRLHFEGLTNADFIAVGRRIGTPRLAKELSRNYGRFADWIPKATPEQVELLGFLGQDWVRMAIWAGRQAEVRYDGFVAGGSGGTNVKELREGEAERLRGKARRARDRLRNALLHLAGGIPGWNQRIGQAYATSVTQEVAADSLEALAELADKMLAEASPGMQARRAKSTLTAAAVAGHHALAAELAEAAKAAAAVRNAPAVSQADVDLWDGIAISFFEQFVETLDDAREEDPSLPAPSIIGLRSWFRRGGSGGGGGKDDAPNAPDAPPAGPADPRNA